MSKFSFRHVFTSESVSEGHPDKVCDQVSDAILDACLAVDPGAHVACETAAGHDLLVNLGETSLGCGAKIDTESIAREVVRDIGYDRPGDGFSYDTFKYVSNLHEQSRDIAMGVNRESLETQGAGDQGMMFGYACRETESLMPAPIMFSHKLLSELANMRKSRAIPYLRPDSKAQVSVLYEDGKPLEIRTIVLSHQTDDVDIAVIRRDLEAAAREILASTGMLSSRTEFHINPTGKFVIGGPCGDAGVTGRKIIVDTYGGVGAHGGGAFSGKDPSKVDRSAAYYARYAAKNVVAAGAADKCEIQVAYAIGRAEPVSVNVCAFGTGKTSEHEIARMLQDSGIFDFRPGMLIKELGLTTPKGWKYRDTVNYGHFGRDIFPWERLDKAEAVREALKLR